MFTDMIHIVTSNPLNIKSLSDYNDNFIICHLQEKILLPFANAAMGYYFKVYHQDGMIPDEMDDYQNEANYKYDFIPVRSIPEALKLIAQDVVSSEQSTQKEADDTGNTREEVTLVTACGYKWNKQVVQKLNFAINRADGETTCLDLYTYLRAPSLEKLGEIVKNNLQSQFVYPEDPIAFSYALMRMLNGVYM